MSQVLTIRVRREPQYAILTAVGEIDIATVSQLREQLFALAGDGRPLVAGLDQVSFIDAAGLGVLVGAASGRRARQQPACGLRPAPDPAAVRPARAWTARYPWPARSPRRCGPWQHRTRPPPAPPASPAQETLRTDPGRAGPSDGHCRPHQIKKTTRTNPAAATRAGNETRAPRTSLTPTAAPVFSGPNQAAKDMRRPCQQRWAAL